MDKYPRTRHVRGSSIQHGDDPKKVVPYSHLVGKYIVVEEKFDGANTGIRFNAEADMRLQCRGHYLTGGGRERHFNKFKAWASCHEDALFDVLTDRYVMYSEYMASKHTQFYDRLCHLVLEFDLLDTKLGGFLSTAARRQVLRNAPVLSAAVLYAGLAPATLAELMAMVRPSLARSPDWKEVLIERSARQGIDVALTLEQTEDTMLAEGIYIKVEEGGYVVDRLKYVRPGFIQSMTDDDHWLDRPIVPNLLVGGADIFAPALTHGWDWQAWKRPLLREDFKGQVMQRSKGRCVICGTPATAAHHILDRKLFADGGYYLGNGAAVCAQHHLECESTAITVDQVRQACGIQELILPAGFAGTAIYNKWGDELLYDGTLVPGPLADDEGARRAKAMLRTATH